MTLVMICDALFITMETQIMMTKVVFPMSYVIYCEFLI